MSLKESKKGILAISIQHDFTIFLRNTSQYFLKVADMVIFVLILGWSSDAFWSVGSGELYTKVNVCTKITKPICHFVTSKILQLS